MGRRLTSFASLLPIAAFALLAGCQTARVSQPAIPAPALQLTSAAPVQIANDCRPSGSVVVDFTVQPDGTTSAIQMPDVPDCVHDALTAWVTSFRYLPPRVAVPGTVEWLMVSAKKGS